jgi:hypothetical protein
MIRTKSGPRKPLILIATTLRLLNVGTIPEPATMGCPGTSETGCQVSRPKSLCTICL